MVKACEALEVPRPPPSHPPWSLSNAQFRTLAVSLGAFQVEGPLRSLSFLITLYTTASEPPCGPALPPCLLSAIPTVTPVSLRAHTLVCFGQSDLKVSTIFTVPEPQSPQALPAPAFPGPQSWGSTLTLYLLSVN